MTAPPSSSSHHPPPMAATAATAAPTPAPMLEPAPVSAPVDQQQQQQQQQAPPRPTSAAAKLVKSNLLKRIWKTAPPNPSSAPPKQPLSKPAPNTPKASQHSRPQASEQTAATAKPSAASSPAKDAASHRAKEAVKTSPPSRPPPSPPRAPKQSDPSSPKKPSAPLSLFRSPSRSAKVANEKSPGSAGPSATSPMNKSPPRPDMAALSKPNGKYRAHHRSTSSSSFARASAGVGLDAAEPFEQQASPTAEPDANPLDSHPTSNGSPASARRTHSIVSQKSEKEQRQMLAAGSTAAAQAFAEQVTGLGPPSPPAVTNATLPVVAHTSPKVLTSTLRQPLNAPAVNSEQVVRVQEGSPASPLSKRAGQPAASGLLSAAPISEKHSGSGLQPATLAPSLSSRTDEIPTPTTDSGSHILSGAPSITTSATSSPAQLTPASSAGEGNGILARSSLIENGKLGANLATPSTLAVPSAPEKKRRSFLGIRLGSSKSLKTPTSASPMPEPQSPIKAQQPASNHSSASLAAEAVDHVPEVPALPRDAAGLDLHVSRSRSTRQTTSPQQHALLPGQRMPGQRQAGSPTSGNRMSHPPTVTYKSFPSQPVAISKGSTASLGQYSTSSRRRYKDTRDLSALVNELAAEEAHAAAQYQKQQAMLQQQHSFSSAGADLSSTFSHQSKSLHVPRPAPSPYQPHVNPSGLSTATASRNTSQTSLNVVPLNAGIQASATSSPVLANQELNSNGQSDAMPINGKRPPSREIQSSASSVASHPGQLSSSLPTSPHQSMRLRTHTQEGSNWDAASSHSQRSGISTPSHHMSAASAAFRNRAAAMGFSALDAGLTGVQSLIVDPFGLPMASDSPFDASKAYRSPTFSNGSDDGSRGFGYSEAELATNASTSSFHGASDAVSIEGGQAPTSASHGSSGGQRVRRTMLTMSLYDPDTDKQGIPTPPSGRTREASTESGAGKAGGKVGERSGSRLSSPFGSRAPSRSVTPKTSSRALDEAVKHEEKLRIKEEKRRVKEEKKQELQNAKRAKQWQDEMNMMPRDPKASKATREEMAAREAEKEKQKALAKGVDEALRRAQEAQAIALQEQYKRQQALLQKPADGSSSRNSRRTSPQSSIRPSSQLDAVMTASDHEIKEMSLSPQTPAAAPNVAIVKPDVVGQETKVSVPLVNGAVAPAVEGVSATSRNPSLSPGRPPRAPARASSSNNMREVAS